MRTGTELFGVAILIAIVAVASTVYLRHVRRDFSAPTTITMGTVVRKGALLGEHDTPGYELFCWVDYKFTAPGGGILRNSRFWQPACGVAPGRPIPVQHLIADPRVNRPAGSEPWFPSWLFFAAGVTVVVAFIMRGSEPGTE
jgi:hypothetical protein